MQNVTPYLFKYKQHEKLTIRVSSNEDGHLPADVAALYGKPHRQSHYFFIFIVRGHTHHSADLQTYDITDGQALFMVPNQIHLLPKNKLDSEYFKIGFDENCLSLLPKQFPFLIDPLNNQKISFSEKAAQRVKIIFQLLAQLLKIKDVETALVLAHLNSLLTEFNTAYFDNVQHENSAGDKLSKYIQFKLMVENELSEHLSVNTIATRLTVNTNSLYNLVKQYSGLSPKEYITHRIILEAQRRLYYSESSIKELAFDLGYNDPEYFSRLFKKVTGKSISQFVADIQDLSGN